MSQHTRSAITALFVVILIDALGWGIVYPILEPILLKNVTGLFSLNTSIDIRNFWYESMVGLYCFCMFITSPLLGSLSDRFGRKIILMISMFGNATGFLLSGLGLLVNSLGLIVLGRIVAGATAGSLPIAQAAIMDISSDHEKPQRLSLVALANVIGFAMGPALGSFFLDQHIWGRSIPYELPFWITTVIGLIGALLVYFFFKETFMGNSQQKINIFTGVVNLYEAVTVKKTRALCLVFFCFMMGWVMFFSLLPLLLSEKFQWQAFRIGYFISFTGVFLGLGVVFVMPCLVKAFTLERIVSLSFLFLLVCTILFPLVHHQFYLWVLIILTIFVPFAYISLISLFSKIVSINEQGKIMGVIGSIFAFNWGAGPMLIGYIASFGFGFAYTLTGGLFLVALLIFALYIAKKTSANFSYALDERK